MAGSISPVGELASVAAAVAAVAAIVVALYGAPLRRLLLRPRLKLRIEKPEGVEVKEEWSVDGEMREVSVRYFHLRVSNPARWMVVNGVKVYLLKLEERAPQTKHYAQIWADETPLPWRYPDEKPKQLQFGPDQDCDLCAIDSNGDLRFFQAAKHGLPNEFRYRRGKIDLRLTLQARGAETDSRQTRVTLKWDGRWPSTGFSIT